MKVTKWVNWDTEGYIDVDNVSLEDLASIEEAIIKEIKDKKYVFSGSDHQHHVNCAPVIDDKYIYCVSMRKWGGIMARAYNVKNDDGLAYVLYAWGIPDDEQENYPE